MDQIIDNAGKESSRYLNILSLHKEVISCCKPVKIFTTLIIIIIKVIVIWISKVHSDYGIFTVNILLSTLDFK